MEVENREDEDDISQYLLKEIQYSNVGNDNMEKVQLDEIISIICELEGVSIQEIIKRSRIQKYPDIRKAIVLLSEKYSNTTAVELARKLNIPPSMVSKIKSGVSKRTEYVNEIIK